jgi:molybdopterin converting factor small subunit
MDEDMPVVRYWAGARELAGTVEDPVTGETLAEVLAEVGRRHGERMAALLPRCVLLVDGEQVSAAAAGPLAERSLVEILPPYAGG